MGSRSDSWKSNVSFLVAEINSNPSSEYSSITPFDNETELITHIRTQLEKASTFIRYSNSDFELIESPHKVIITGKYPKIMVMGALGRCGTGACDFATRVGFPRSYFIDFEIDFVSYRSSENILKWDIKETAKGGPFDEIIDADIFVNCIYLSSPIPAFLVPSQLEAPKRALSVIVDVSCDATNPHNPIPLYTETTTFDHPVIKVTPKYDLRSFCFRSI